MSELLDRNSLVTLTGSGGCGKSRLATEVALRVLPMFRDGGALVDLGPIESPAMVPSAVAAGTGVPEGSAVPLSELLAVALADRHFLLVVNNCDRVAEACAQLLYGLLQRCPNLVVLATSRSPLCVDGEVTVRVPSLSLPSSDGFDPVADLLGSEAGQLLMARAQLAQPGFRVTATDAPAAAAICRRLDGVPLAIELAASRLRVLGVTQLAEGIEDRFRLLSAGPRTAPPRQRTLEASIDWSYELLSDSERLLFLRLAVFAASFTVDAAEAVCADGDLSSMDVRTVLADLVDRSLLQLETDAKGARYRMLETIREYALIRLAETAEDAALRNRHLAYLRAIATWFDVESQGRGLKAALDRVEPLVDDVRHASEWAMRSGRISDALQLATDVRLFWVARGRNQEGQSLLATVLEAEWQPDDAGARVRALLAAGELCIYGNDLPGQARWAGEALRAAGELGDSHLEARARVLAGWAKAYVEPPAARTLLMTGRDAATDAGDHKLAEVAWYGIGAAAVASGDFAAARDALGAGLDIAPSHGRLDMPYGLGLLGYVDILQGRLASAITALDKATSILGGELDRIHRDLVATWLAVALTHRGRHAEARAIFEWAITGGRTVGNPTAYAQLHLGLMEGALGDAAAARALIDEALPTLGPLGPWFEAQALVGLGDAAAAAGDTGRAATHWHGAMTRAESSRNPLARTVASLGMARAAVLNGDRDRACSLRRGALRAALDTDYRIGAIDALEALAVMLAEEAPADAARLLAAVDAERARTGYVRFPVHEPAYAAAQRLIADQPESSITFDEAVGLALGSVRRPTRPVSGWESLTPAEEPVAALVAEGLTNREIGERLFISRRTVQAHLSHVFTKLSIESRAQLAAVVSRRELGLLVDLG